MPPRRDGFWLANGVCDDGHLAAMGPACAEFLWCVRHQAGEAGLVRYGHEVALAEIARGVGHSVRQVQRNLAKLATVPRPGGDRRCRCGCEGCGYIEQARGQRGVRLRVLHQKRFHDEGRAHHLQRDRGPVHVQPPAVCKADPDTTDPSCQGTTTHDGSGASDRTDPTAWNDGSGASPPYRDQGQRDRSRSGAAGAAMARIGSVTTTTTTAARPRDRGQAVAAAVLKQLRQQLDEDERQIGEE